MMARPNAVRHDWPRRELTAVLEDLPAPPIRTGAAGAAIRAWERWQDGLTMRSTWLAELMPLPRKLVLDGRAQDAGVRVLTVRARGDAVGHTAGGSWLNMAESIQRILKQRAPGDQHPEVTGQIIGWFEAAGHWNASPTLFAGGGGGWSGGGFSASGATSHGRTRPIVALLDANDARVARRGRTMSYAPDSSEYHSFALVGSSRRVAREALVS